MKKAIAILTIIIATTSARSDVIFLPIPYTIFSYSVETIYSFEIIKRSNSTTVFWGGVGIVGSFFYLEYPYIGAELAIERRFYFKREQFKHFFFSTYLGTAYMQDFDGCRDIGIVPG